MPAPVACVPIPPVGKATPRTDADLAPIFAEACEGLGQSLTWGHRYVIPCEQIAAWLRDHHDKRPGVVRRVATHYRAQLGAGTPSIARFAADFDRWHAAMVAAGAAAGKPAARPAPQRDESRLGAPSAAVNRNGWCKIHPGRAAVGTSGLCEQCRDNERREAVA